MVIVQKHVEVFWKYHRDEPALMTDAGTFANFTGKNASFKFKQQMTGETGADGTKNVKIMVPLKYLINFWRTLETPLISCEINLILTWLWIVLYLMLLQIRT